MPVEQQLKSALDDRVVTANDLLSATQAAYDAQTATLDELSGGRAEVVFGIGNIAMLEQYGVEWRGTRPIARLREAHQVMRTVLDEGAIDFDTRADY